MEARINKAFQAAVDIKKQAAVAAIVLDKSGKVLYKGAFGTTNILDATAAPFTLDTPTMIFSCTKLVTTILALQLLEEGKLSLTDPVEKYDPDFAAIKVLEGFDGEGKPILRAPKSKATILHLLTHTAGFAYDFFSEKTMAYRLAMGQTPGTTMAIGTKATYSPPLEFDPGQQYAYGYNTDWVGFVIEKITGKKIEEVVRERILTPLRLENTRTTFEEGQARMLVHARLEDGSLVSVPDIKTLEAPEVRGGGEFLISTVSDYAQILLAVLNGGTHPTLHTRLLSADTVANYLFSDLITPICSPDNVGVISQATVAQMTNTGEMLPGVPKTWSAALVINEEDVPTGRKKGSGAWAGLANSYYFIDPASGKLAFFTTSVIPFFDPESQYLFDELERAMYRHDGKGSATEAGGNYGPLRDAV